jgi:RNA polymerase sigma-70 factor (ECF subfamily)
VTLHEQRINVLAIRMSFAKLSRDHQKVIALVDVAGLTYGEASAVLQVPKGTIMSRLSRAREALLAAMREATVIPIARLSRRSHA